MAEAVCSLADLWDFAGALSTIHPGAYVIGGVLIKPGGHTDPELWLTPAERHAILALARHYPEPAPRAEIMNSPGCSPGYAQVLVQRLRLRLAGTPLRVKTRYGVGYQLVVE